MSENENNDTNENQEEENEQRESQPERSRHRSRSSRPRRRSQSSRRRGRRRKEDYFQVNSTEPNYKEVDILQRFLTDHGKIVPRRVSGSCARHQAQVTRAIKRARVLALLPYTNDQIR